MRIALTGGIADGKSTVLGFMAEAGFPTLDVDSVVRELHSDRAVAAEIRAAFGDEVFQGAGLNRAALRETVLSDSKARRRLNAIVHGPALRRAFDWAGAQGGACVVEIPLLIETCTQGLFDLVWVVTAGRDEQVRRLAERLGNVGSAEALLGTQLPTEVKVAFADVTQRTNLTFDTVRSTVTRTFEELGLSPRRV